MFTGNKIQCLFLSDSLFPSIVVSFHGKVPLPESSMSDPPVDWQNGNTGPEYNFPDKK